MANFDKLAEHLKTTIARTSKRLDELKAQLDAIEAIKNHQEPPLPFEKPKGK